MSPAKDDTRLQSHPAQALGPSLEVLAPARQTAPVVMLSDIESVVAIYFGLSDRKSVV